MIKFRTQGSSAKANASKKVVVEVKHPRKLNKANSIWGGIDLAKHSHDVEQHLPVASEKAVDQKIEGGISNENSVKDKQPIVRVLEDKKQVAEIEAGKQAALNFDPESDLFIDEKAHMQRSDAYMQRLDSPRLSADKEAPPAEVVGSLETEVPIEEEAGDLSFDDIAEKQAVVIDEDQFYGTADASESHGDIEFDSDVEPAFEHLLHSHNNDVSREPEASLEVSSTEDADDEEDSSPIVDSVASYRLLKALPIRFRNQTKTKKIPGIRYVRRTGELQVARGDKWKVPRILKSNRK
jgi:hypothetical protein